MRFLLAYTPEAIDEPCSLCGQPASPSAGLRLLVADNSASLCRECGRKHAPALASLVHLAEAATHIGRIHRHSVFPPLTALLELADAAEKFAQNVAAPAEKRAAG